MQQQQVQSAPVIKTPVEQAAEQVANAVSLQWLEEMKPLTVMRNGLIWGSACGLGLGVVTLATRMLAKKLGI